MSVPKISGQCWQPALGIRARPIASAQDFDRHAVTQIMEARPRCVRDAPHPELPGQPQERAIEKVWVIRRPSGDTKNGSADSPARNSSRRSR